MEKIREQGGVAGREERALGWRRMMSRAVNWLSLLRSELTSQIPSGRRHHRLPYDSDSRLDRCANPAGRTPYQSRSIHTIE
jgi:hypothetical protein